MGDGAVHVIPRGEAVMATGTPQHAYLLGPKGDDHATVGCLCLACGKPFVKGDFTTMLPLGPGRHPRERVAMLSGKPYTAQALELHYTCVTGLLPGEDMPEPAPTQHGGPAAIIPGQQTLEDLGLGGGA